MSRAQQLLVPTWGGAKWLLRDEFTDTRAAGAVNSTPATPGPGTRIVTDTDGKYTISGGNLVCSGAMVPITSGDPGYWLSPAIVRTAGRVLLWKGLAVADVTNLMWLGTDTDAAGGPVENAFYVYGDTLTVYDGGTGSPMAIPTDGTAYDLIMVMRASGVYYFWRPTGTATWALLWISATNANTPLYIAVANRNCVFTLDAVRIPDALWLPTPLAYDTFTRANGALGSSETTGSDGQAVAARTWNNRIGTTLVATNKAQASALDGGIAIATVDTGTVNAITDATLTRAGNEVGVVLRYVDADNYIRAIHDGTNCKLIKRVAAAETDVISAVVALGAGAIRVVPDGTSFALYLNDAQIGATSAINDAALQTGTQQGLFSTNVGNTQDGFLVMARGSNGEYAALSKWGN